MQGYIILGLVFIVIASSESQALQGESDCTRAEIRKPKETFFRLVGDFQLPGADAKQILKNISEVINNLPDHIDNVHKFCDESKIGVIDTLHKFRDNIKLVHEIIEDIDTENYKAAKTKIQSIKCEVIMHYLVQNYTNSHDNFDKFLEVLKIMDNTKAINLVNGAMVYAINDSIIEASGVIIPLMKRQILSNNSTMDENSLMWAKFYMKQMVKKTLNGCYKGLIALSKIDKDAADETMYEFIFSNVSEAQYIPAFDMTLAAPNKHYQIIGYKGIYDKLYLLGMQNGLILGKVLILVNNLIKSDEIQNNPQDLELATSMLKEATEFAKNVMTGYTCQDQEQVKSLVTGEPEETVTHNDFIVLYDPEQSEEISNGKFVEKADGDFLMLTIDREFRGHHVVYSVVIKNADYPDDIHMKGKIVSRKIIGKIPATFEEICAMDPKPVFKICSTFAKTFTLPMDKHTEHRVQKFESFKNYIKGCDKN